MAKRTVLNEKYKGLVEVFPIPAEVHERDSKKYATFGSVTPIHVCNPEEVAKYAETTHHYADIFTDQLLAPLGELVYVRIDENTAEKVFINRTKRLLLTSADGQLAQWQLAPSFESANQYVAGAPIVNKDGALVSVVTARKGNHYAVSTSETENGYFETSKQWKYLEAKNGTSIYGDKSFATREELRAYIAGLPAAALGPHGPPTPVVVNGPGPRISLVAQNGRQISHHHLRNVITVDIDYL